MFSYVPRDFQKVLMTNCQSTGVINKTEFKRIAVCGHVYQYMTLAQGGSGVVLE